MIMAEFTRRDFAKGITSALIVSGSSGLAEVRPSRPDFPTTLKLEKFWSAARSLGARAVVIKSGSRTLLSKGAVREPMRIASIRKSIISTLYGIAVDDEKMDLSLTLKQLGINDYQPLTDVESRATIRHLLQARSGVYIPTASETSAMKAKRPSRGQYLPGEHWYYNNWDFNVLGEIYQRITGKDLFMAVQKQIAKPLRWRDFDPYRHTRWSYDTDNPRFPAYQLKLSTRDLARFGQMFLRNNIVGKKNLISDAWIKESTRPYSVTGKDGWSSGYGYMWWLASNPSTDAAKNLPLDMFTAAGNGGRYVTVVPSRELVIAVQPNERSGKSPVELYTDKNAYTILLAGLLS